MIFLRPKGQQGFTLVEALVAMAVLAVSLTPIFTQVNASFRLSRAIQESLTASMLAQEGIELVRGMRDDNWFTEMPFETNLDNCQAPDGCRVQYASTGGCLYGDPPFCLLEDDDVPLHVDDEGLYQYGAGRETPFYRTVTISPLDAAPPYRQMEIVSTVTWESPGQPLRQIQITGYLFDWLAF